MSGLLAKDICLIKKRRMFMIITIVMAWILGVMGANDFVVGYLAMLGAVFVVSTISYDEMNDGYSFLFTLPIDAKGYVIEKFILSYFISVIFWIIGVVFLYIGRVLAGLIMGDFTAYLIMIPTAFFIVAVMIPLQLKFGAEKSRAVMILGVGICMALWFIIEKIMDSINAGEAAITDNFLAFFSNMTAGTVTLVMYLITLVVTIISVCTSISVLKNKEM